MDVAAFTSSLLHALAELSFVQAVDLQTEAFVVKGRILLEEERFVQVYFNDQTGTVAFALIENERRLWGVDYDSIRGWHKHPVQDSNLHIEMPPLTISEVVQEMGKAWKLLP